MHVTFNFFSFFPKSKRFLLFLWISIMVWFFLDGKISVSKKIFSRLVFFFFFFFLSLVSLVGFGLGSFSCVRRAVHQSGRGAKELEARNAKEASDR